MKNIVESKKKEGHLTGTQLSSLFSHFVSANSLAALMYCVNLLGN